MIITLCGSTRFRDDFYRINEKLTLEGNIVLMPGVFGHMKDEEPSKETKEMLDELHKKKIDLSDAIYVINPNQYIGASTRSEIEYAVKNNKRIFYME